MAFDAWLRRFFPLVVLALLALAAWFSARGVSALLGARVAGAPAPSPVAPTNAPSSSPARGGAAAPILARNPFDSVTGPLGSEVAPAPVPATAPSDVEPLAAPPCGDVEARIVTEADDPRASQAALEVKGGGARLYRVGDPVGARRVAYIGFNALRRTPAVWLTGADGLCQALLFERGAGAEPPPERPALAEPPRARAPVDLAAAIRREGDTRTVIARAAVDEILSDPRRLMPDSAILFETTGEDVLGVRIFKITPDSLLARLGIRSGDRVESVNGVHVTNRESALEGYQGLRGPGPVEVQVTRNGRRVTIALEPR